MLRWYQDRKIMTKLMVGFSEVALLTLLVGWTALRSAGIEDRRFDTAYRMHFMGVATLGNMNTGLNSMSAATAQSLLARDSREIAALKAGYERHAGEVAEDLRSADGFIVTEAGRAQLAGARRAYDEWKRNNDEVWRFSEAHQQDQGRAILDGNRTNAQAADDAFAALVRMKTDLMKVQAQEQDSNSRTTRRILLLLVAGSVITAILLGFIIARIIVTPLTRGVQLMEAVAEGDFTQTLDVDSRDEVGRLAVAMNKTVSTVRSALAGVYVSAATVSESAGQLSSASQSISAGAQEQASALEETAASLEEMTSAVKQNADNAQQAAQLARGAREVAEKGGKVVGEAVAAMREINASSRKISDIISAIDEIAFQTNLLALNAAVEAARAGEQGRGFAVVAGEVRNLAQRSAAAAREIKGLIHDSVERVELGSRLVDQSGAALEEIVTSAKRVTDIVGEIAASSREQSVGLEQVNMAVTQMDAVTQSNASQTEELAATAEGLSGQAQALMTLVQQFRLGDAGPAAAFSSAPTAKLKLKVLPMRSANPRPGRKAMPASAVTGTDGFEEF